MCSVVGVDSTIIQQRHDFLRPDSTVAVIVLTDENDSEIDVRSYEQTGYQFMSQTWSPPRGTRSARPIRTDPKCKSCGFVAAPAATRHARWANYTDNTDWGDNLNLRHVHMLQKYGLDPQFPLTRYYNGLTSEDGPEPGRRVSRPARRSYVGHEQLHEPALRRDACRPRPTPTDAASIGTTLCTLPAGGRSPAAMSSSSTSVASPTSCSRGRPGEPTAAARRGPRRRIAPRRTRSRRRLGQDSRQGRGGVHGSERDAELRLHRIDPHMMSRSAAHPARDRAAPQTSPAADQPGHQHALGARARHRRNPSPDPINGREWITNSASHSLPVDREYACIFQLPPASQRDCSTLGSATMGTIEYNSCDCTGLGDTPEQVPPLCSKTSSSDGDRATSPVERLHGAGLRQGVPHHPRADAREHAGAQGIVSSLCPIHTERQRDRRRSALRLPAGGQLAREPHEGALAAQCVPALQPATSGPTAGQVPCLIMVTFPKGTGPTTEAECDSFGAQNGMATYAGPGSTVLSDSVLTQFQTQQHASYLLAGDAGPTATDPSLLVTCALANQLPGPLREQLGRRLVLHAVTDVREHRG